MASNIEDRVREIAERVARDHGLEIVDVELRGGGKSRMLRITIDKEAASSKRQAASVAGAGHGEAAEPAEHGVTHEDCANVSREVGTILDVEDVIPGASYTLEVSSPGLDRKLSRARDFERFAGSHVKVLVREPVNGQKHFDGRLTGFRDGRLTLDLKQAPKKSKKRTPSARGPAAAESEPKLVEIELANVERANVVPEF